MTITDIKNQLISHFYDNSSFDMEVDSAKINLDDELNKVRAEVISTVLGELVDLGMIKKVARETWLLTQPFDSFSQTVVLSASASEVIADTINSFRDANDITGDLCDKTKIKEEDVMNLINILHSLLEDDLPPEAFEDDNEEIE